MCRKQKTGLAVAGAARFRRKARVATRDDLSISQALTFVKFDIHSIRQRWPEFFVQGSKASRFLSWAESCVTGVEHAVSIGKRLAVVDLLRTADTALEQLLDHLEQLSPESVNVPEASRFRPEQAVEALGV